VSGRTQRHDKARRRAKRAQLRRNEAELERLRRESRLYSAEFAGHFGNHLPTGWSRFAASVDQANALVSCFEIYRDAHRLTRLPRPAHRIDTRNRTVALGDR
jgi:hypothetical protein